MILIASQAGAFENKGDGGDSCVWIIGFERETKNQSHKFKMIFIYQN